MITSFVGTGTRLADTDLPRLGRTLVGVGEDEVHAFLDVETNGGGYDKLRRPKMLFEPHVFYRHVEAGDRARAMQQGVAYQAWRKDYPADSYPRLDIAMAIDPDAALKSASWGIGQVLGENFAAAGYLSVEAFVRDMVQGGEAAQLQAALRFIVANKLDDELRAHNWAGFARGYNGAHYAENAYDTKLAAAFKKWQAIRDTPWPLPAATTMAMATRATDERPVVAVPATTAPAVRSPGALVPASTARADETWSAWFQRMFFRRQSA